MPVNKIIRVTDLIVFKSSHATSVASFSDPPDFIAIRSPRHAQFRSYAYAAKTPEMHSTLILVTSLYACSVFQYEPVIQPGSHQYLHHMTLYECRGNQTQLDAAAQTNGDVCNAPDKPAFQCNTIAATWSLGSEVRRELQPDFFGTIRPRCELLRIATFLRVTRNAEEL